MGKKSSVNDAAKLEAFEVLKGLFVVDPFGQIVRFTESRKIRGRIEIFVEENLMSFCLSMREVGQAARSPWPDTEYCEWSCNAHPDLLMDKPLFLCLDYGPALWISRYLRCLQTRFEKIDGTIGPHDRIWERAEKVLIRARLASEKECFWKLASTYRNRLHDRWWQAAIRRVSVAANNKWPESVTLRLPASIACDQK